MADIIISLGSNYHQGAHIQWASERLLVLLNEVRFSRKLWTQDIHQRGIWYMNRLAIAKTSLSVEDLERALKAIEAESRRTPEHVTIDLDLMQYDGKHYHLKDWSRSYIQLLINDII